MVCQSFYVNNECRHRQYWYHRNNQTPIHLIKVDQRLGLDFGFVINIEVNRILLVLIQWIGQLVLLPLFFHLWINRQC